MQIGKFQSDSLIPSVWAGWAVAWLEYHIERERPLPPLWAVYQVSQVVKDGDLSNTLDALLDRYCEPACLELLARVQANNTNVKDYGFRCPDQYQLTAECRIDKHVVRVGMGYDTYSAGCRITISYQRTS